MRKVLLHGESGRTARSRPARPGQIHIAPAEIEIAGGDEFAVDEKLALFLRPSSTSVGVAAAGAGLLALRSRRVSPEGGEAADSVALDTALLLALSSICLRALRTSLSPAVPLQNFIFENGG